MCFLLPFSHQYRHGTSQKGKKMFLIIPLTVSLLLLVGLALVQLAHSNPIWFDNGCSIPISLHGTTKSPIYFSNIFPRLPFCSGQFPFAISNDRPQNIIGMIPNLQINMTTDSYIFRKKKTKQNPIFSQRSSFKERLSSVDEWDSLFYSNICIFLSLCVYKTNFLSLRCSICCKSFKNCSSLQDHCELLSHWSEEDSDEESGDEFDSDEYLFSSSDDEWDSSSQFEGKAIARVSPLSNAS